MIYQDHNFVLWQVLFFNALGSFIGVLVTRAISDCVNLNVHSKTGGFVFQLCPDYVFKQVSDPVELHDVFRLALQPELVKFYEEIAEKRTIRGAKLKTYVSCGTMIKVGN